MIMATKTLSNVKRQTAIPQKMEGRILKRSCFSLGDTVVVLEVV